MAQIKWSQLPIAQDVSETAYAPIIDLSQPVGGQNQIIPLSLLLSNNVISVTLNGTRVTTLDPTYFTFDEAGVTLQNIPDGVTVNGDPISVMDPTFFTIGENGLTLQNLPSGITINGGPITTLDPNYFVNNEGQASLQNLPTQVSVNGDPVSTLDPTYFTIGDGGLTLQNIPTGTAVTINGDAVSALDSNVFGFTEGGASLTFSNIGDIGELSSDTTILVLQNNYVYTTTLAEIAAYIGTVSTTPTITLPSIPDVTIGNDLLVNGTLTNYGNAPNLLVLINGEFIGVLGYLPFFGDPLGTINSNTSFSLDVPSSNFNTTGTYSVTIADWVGTISNTQTFNVDYAIATSAFISGCASPISLGSNFDNGENGISPSNAQAWAVINNGSGDIGSRISFTSGNFPTFAPSAAGTDYTIEIWDSATGGNLLATSNVIVVSPTAANGASLGNVPSTGMQGQAISGVTANLNPTGSYAWAVLNVNGSDEGSRIQFTDGDPVPTLTPQGGGNYVIDIYQTGMGGSPIYTSSTITVTGVMATACTLSGTPSPTVEGQAIGGITATLTPSNGYAYAVLDGPNGVDGSTVGFSEGALPPLTPSTYGAYSILIFDAPTGGNILTSTGFTVSRPVATGASISVPGGPIFANSSFNATVDFEPTEGIGYAVLNDSNGTEIDPRTEVDGSGMVSLTTTTVTGSYTAYVYDAPTGGNELSSTPFTVYELATAATITGSPNISIQNQSITGFGITVTPDESSAYAVLAYNNGDGPVEDGARQFFTGNTLPTLTPSQISTNYELWIVTTSGDNTGEFLAQSSPFAVLGLATGATITGSAVNPTEGQAVSGLSIALTPSGGTSYAYAALFNAFGQEGSRVIVSDGALTGFVPQGTGNYAIEVYDNPNNGQGNQLAASSAFFVLGEATGASVQSDTISGATQGVEITGLTFSLTPSGGVSYASAVLMIGSTQYGDPVTIYDGVPVTGLVPQLYSDNYYVAVYGVGGELVATSPFTVAPTPATFGTPPSLPDGPYYTFVPISGITATFLPNPSTAWAGLYLNGTLEGSLVEFVTQGTFPTLTPQSNGTYQVNVYEDSGAANLVCQSSTFSVSIQAATALNVTNVPSSGVQYNELSPPTISYTPTNGFAYLVLVLNGSEEGSRQTSYQGIGPVLIPQSFGNYTLEAFDAPTGGNNLFTSGTISVTQANAVAASIADVPSTGSQGTAITGITCTLTQNNTLAWGVLNGPLGLETPYQFSSTFPDLIPNGFGTYTVEVYDTYDSGTNTYGTLLVQSSSIAVSEVDITGVTGFFGFSITGYTYDPIEGTGAVFTPTIATAYAILQNNSNFNTEEGSRIQFPTYNSFLPAIAPQGTGNYQYNIYNAQTGGTLIGSSPTFNVETIGANSATFTSAGSGGIQGEALNGYNVALTPTYGVAWTVLVDPNNQEEGSRTEFTNENLPALTPQGNGQYYIRIANSPSGGTILTQFAVTVVP